MTFLDLSQAAALRQSAPNGLTEGVTRWASGARIRALRADDDALHNFVLRGESPEAAMIGSAMRAFALAAPNLGAASFDAIADGVTVMVTKTVSTKLNRPHDSSASPTAIFVVIRRFIDGNLQAPGLEPKMIAAKFALSRPSLYRLFEPAGGVAAYIRRARLSRAFQEIAVCDGGPIGVIAARYGSRTVGAFNRRFSEVYGKSPRGGALTGGAGDASRRIRHSRRPWQVVDAVAEVPGGIVSCFAPIFAIDHHGRFRSGVADEKGCRSA